MYCRKIWKKDKQGKVQSTYKVQKGKQLIEVIIDEMGRGNFSFLILLIGILQLIVMLKKKK